MNTETASRFFAFLSLLCVVATALVVIGAALLRAINGPPWLARLRLDVGRAALGPAWIVAAVTTLGSLYYSDVAHYTPCKLCWMQRICMYPLSVILGIAWFRRDVSVRWYALPLCAMGAAVAGYHTWLQAVPDRSSAFCTVEAPCSARYVWELGFVSLPFMSLSAFAFIATMLVVATPSPRLADGDATRPPEVTS